MATKLRNLISLYKNCENCELHKTRNKLVHYGGKIPCDILFVGEAPGRNEDTLGQPFIGPAGRLLKNMIASITTYDGLRVGFTNVVACIPFSPDKSSIEIPNNKSIKSCKDRLRSFMELANPKTIVAVDSVAKKSLVKYHLDFIDKLNFYDVVHPASILRGTSVFKDITVKRCKIRLRKAALQTKKELKTK